MTIRPIPEGFHHVTPYLMVNGAPLAIEFYQTVFGATEVLRLSDPSGRIAHAEVKIGDSLLMLAEESLEWGNKSPQTLGGSPVVLNLYVPDVDEVVRQAVAAGAKVLIPVADQFYGDRSGRISDPFGHIWIVSTHIEDVPHDEAQRRFDAMMKK